MIQWPGLSNFKTEPRTGVSLNQPPTEEKTEKFMYWGISGISIRPAINAMKCHFGQMPRKKQTGVARSGEIVHTNYKCFRKRCNQNPIISLWYHCHQKPTSAKMLWLPKLLKILSFIHRFLSRRRFISNNVVIYVCEKKPSGRFVDLPRNLQVRTHVSRTPKKPEYLVARSQLTWSGVRWDSVPFNFWWIFFLVIWMGGKGSICKARVGIFFSFRCPRRKSDRINQNCMVQVGHRYSSTLARHASTGWVSKKVWGFWPDLRSPLNGGKFNLREFSPKCPKNSGF